METLKKIAAAAGIFVWLICFTACKKEKSDQDTQKTFQEVLKTTLPDYYIVAQHKSGGNILLSISFTNSGDNIIQGEAHMQGYLRSRPVTINDSGLSYDFNGDGKSVYHFTIEKKEDGTLTLKSFDFVYNAEAGLLSYAGLFKKADAFSFTDAYYEADYTIPSFTFENGKFRWSSYNPVDYPGYYSIGIGFKTNDSQFMGVCVPNWLNTTKPMLLLEESTSLFKYEARIK